MKIVNLYKIGLSRYHTNNLAVYLRVVPEPLDYIEYSCFRDTGELSMAMTIRKNMNRADIRVFPDMDMINRYIMNHNVSARQNISLFNAMSFKGTNGKEFIADLHIRTMSNELYKSIYKVSFYISEYLYCLVKDDMFSISLPGKRTSRSGR